MAQLMYESVPVVSKVSGADTAENPTVLTVHRMLDPHLIAQYETGPVLDDNDVFQCGKCKKQFSSIDVFVNHKTECNNSAKKISDITLPTNVCGIPPNAVVLQKIEIPSSSLSNYPQGLILTETDILQLSAVGLDTNSVTTSANPSMQIKPSHTVIHQPAVDNQTISTYFQQLLRQVSSTNDSNQHQAVEFSILNDKILTRPLILTSQQDGNPVQSLVFNITNESQPQTIICNDTEVDKTSTALSESIGEAGEILNTEEQPADEKEPSTVNIITEFHSSMVKSKKPSSEAEIEDNQAKKDHKLSCAYCWKSFTKNFDLQQHIRCHTGEKPFQCIVCGRAFAQKSNVKKHMQTHKVWPDGLARTLPPLSSKSNSASSDDGTQELICPDEPEEQNEDSLEKIKSGEIDKNSYVCPYCKYVAKSYYKLKSHMKQHDTEKVYKCIVPICGRMFNELDPFLEHVKSHENEMTYRCHECNKNFPSLFDLGTHQLTHSGVSKNVKALPSRRFFRCNYCLNKYSTPAALDHHLATSNHTYSCTFCDKVFPCERYLRRHLQIHSEPESFSCNLCGKGFRTESYLKVHMLVHSEAKPYECTTCKAAFNRKDKLKRHQLIHEPVKRYKCPFRSRGCPKEFNRPDKLKAHILTHSCIKPFTCKNCGRSFARRAHFRDHVKQNHEEEDMKLLNESEHMKLLDESEHSDRTNSGKSDFECEKAHRCKKPNSNRRRKSFNVSYKTHKQKKKGLQNLRNGDSLMKKARAKEILKLNDIDENSKDNDMDCVSDLADDIPTAHIEIISADGTLVTSSDLTHISLGSDMNYGDLHFDGNVVETEVPNGSPISVEAMDTSNSNSLLTSELHSAAGITDFS